MKNNQQYLPRAVSRPHSRILSKDAAACLIPTEHGQIPFLLRRSPQRRTIAICVDEAGDVKVSAPALTAERMIHDFIRAKSRWIVSKREERQNRLRELGRRDFDHGNEFLFLGRKYPLEIRRESCPRIRLLFDGFAWRAAAPEDAPQLETRQKLKEEFIRWYRRQAEEILGGRVFHYARVMNVQPQKIAVRTQKRLWGSCHHHRQAIYLNWKIILCPMTVIDYVVVHELAHLIVPNHSRRFWDQVKKIIPDFREHRQWLRAHALDLDIL